MSGDHGRPRQLSMNPAQRSCADGSAASGGAVDSRVANVIEASIPAVLRERASLQPDDIAVTYLDYDRDRDGEAESLTWAQLYQRASGVAVELSRPASAGDRAVILAPQGLDYVVGFLGALQAGRIAVPLSVPLGGAIDERVGLVLRDASPDGRLDDVGRPRPPSPSIWACSARHRGHRGRPVEPRLRPGFRAEDEPMRRRHGLPAVHLGLDPRAGRGDDVASQSCWPTSSSSCPAISPTAAGCRRRTPRSCRGCRSITTWVCCWGSCAPVSWACARVLTSPVAFLQRPARWMQLTGQQRPSSTRRGRTSLSNWRHGRPPTRTWPGLDLGDVLTILTGSERVHPATLRRFAQRFARFNLRESAIRPSYGLAEATVYVATRAPGERAEIVHFDRRETVRGPREAAAPADAARR